MSEINWKNKYQELKMKFMNSVDTAFRIGFEQGMQQQQQQQAQEQAQAQQEMEMAAQQQAQGGAPGQEQSGGEAQPGEQAPGGDMNAQGSELDQHISQLESMLGKTEDPELQKSIKEIISFRKNELQAIELKKSEKAIAGIAKALNKPAPFSIGKTASANLNPTAKAALSMQEKIVGDIMKSWEQEEKKASTDIRSILANEGLTRKD
jgi:hypothetical protein